MEFLQIAGYAAPVIIIGAVQIAKASGFPSRHAGLLSMGVGTGLGLLAYAGHVYPAVQSALVYVVGGLVAGLVASGAWSTVKATVFGR